MAFINFFTPILASLMFSALGLAIIYFAFKNYREEPDKGFNLIIASFVLVIVGIWILNFGVNIFLMS